MALAGSLKDFNLADIFQLIAQEGKSGILHIKSGRFIMRVYFFNGMTVRADLFEGGKPVDILLNMLLRANVITPKEFQYIIDKRGKSLRRTEDILLDENFVSREDLVLFIRLKNSELLYKLMGWKEGEFEFEPAEISVNSAYDSPQPTDGVLMDTFRVVDEWPSINNVITSVNMKFELNPQAEDFEKVAESNEFGESERRVYKLIIENPNYDVQKLIDISRLGEFETCKALYNLVRTGILIAKRPRHPIPFDALKGGPLNTRRIVIPSVFILNTILGITAILLVVFLIAGISVRIRTIRAEGPNAVVKASIYRRLISDINIERIKNSLDVYRSIQGNFPDNLETLVKSGMLDERDIFYPFRSKYIYNRTKDGYTIESPLY